jgi:hypothetical protein
MMAGAHYGHVIKHLEPSHLNSLPIPALQAASLDEFNGSVKAILAKRDEAYSLKTEGEALFAKSVGGVPAFDAGEQGFVTQDPAIFSQRRRLEAGYHSPQIRAILGQFKRRKLPTKTLAELAERVWWMTRFKRVFGDAGVPYFSAENLFSINPGVSKRVLVEQAENASEFFVRAGWIVMACSGQTYGMLGSVALMTEYHEEAFFSHDLIRIIPLENEIRPAYLFAALGHPTLGRPLLIRYAYGTSIPHLDPGDVSTFPVVRLGDATEEAIAERMERAVLLRSEADQLENAMTERADEIVERFMSGSGLGSDKLGSC